MASLPNSRCFVRVGHESALDWEFCISQGHVWRDEMRTVWAAETFFTDRRWCGDFFFRHVAGRCQLADRLKPLLRRCVLPSFEPVGVVRGAITGKRAVAVRLQID